MAIITSAKSCLDTNQHYKERLLSDNFNRQTPSLKTSHETHELLICRSCLLILNYVEKASQSEPLNSLPASPYFRMAKMRFPLITLAVGFFTLAQSVPTPPANETSSSLLIPRADPSGTVHWTIHETCCKSLQCHKQSRVLDTMRYRRKDGWLTYVPT